jgi:hypothetical protein
MTWQKSISFLLLAAGVILTICSNSLIDGTVPHHPEFALLGAVSLFFSAIFGNRRK